MSSPNPSTPLTRLHKTITSFRHAHGKKVPLFLSVSGMHEQRRHLFRIRIKDTIRARDVKAFADDVFNRFPFHEDFHFKLEGLVLGCDVRSVDVNSFVHGVISR